MPLKVGNILLIIIIIIEVLNYFIRSNLSLNQLQFRKKLIKEKILLVNALKYKEKNIQEFYKIK